jgi:aminoglycoside phosphotransferase (APT) family kinase protein
MEALRGAIEAALVRAWSTPVSVSALRRLAGGASQEAWRVDLRCADRPETVVVRRALGGKMFADALDRAAEYRTLELAHRHGVAAPQPRAWLGEVQGRPAFAMAYLAGETVGRRIVREAALAAARTRLPAQMGVQLARIHAIPPPLADFLPGPDAGQSALAYALAGLEKALGAVEEPYPVLELALAWLRAHAPRAAAADLVTCHGDFRVGNVVVGPDGLVGVLDWEFAHRGPRGGDLAFGAIRAWRFGAVRARYGGVGAVEDFLAAYSAAAGEHLAPADLYYWEVYANAKWAIATITQTRRHLRGEEPSMELASLGRMTAEIELELLSLLDPAHPRYVD